MWSAVLHFLTNATYVLNVDEEHLELILNFFIGKL